MKILATAFIIVGFIAIVPATLVCISNIEKLGGSVFVGLCILIGCGTVALVISDRDKSTGAANN
jgi:hypothetical protein